MIVDMRLRPPLPSLFDTPLFRLGGKSITAHDSLPTAPSVIERSPELLLREMDEAAIEFGVIMGRLAAPAEKRLPGSMGTLPNEEIADWLAQYPSRFVGWVGIDVSRPMPDILAEVDRFMALPGFKGVSIEPTIAPGISGADDRRIYPLYDECVRRNIPISITMSAILQASEHRPYEQGSPAQLYKVAIDFPKLDVHVAHGAWPWVMEMVGVAFTCRNIWLSPDQYMVPPLPGAGEYAKAASYLSERVLFGSSYPFKPLSPMVEAYRAWNWPKLVEHQIFGENALRLMRMK